MASTYSALKIELIGTGEQSGTWGATTNVNLGDAALGEAITGSADVAFSSADVTVTLTDTNATQAARNLRLNLTGTSGGARQLILGSGCQIEKLYLINNGLADAVTVKNTTGTGIAVPAGKSMFVFNNGTNVVDAVTHLSSLTLGTALPIASGGTGSTSTTFVNAATNVTGTLPVGNGGTGAATLTLNNVILGNGTSAVQVVAPSTNGNVLTSNGTTWTSAAPPSTYVGGQGQVFTTTGANTFTVPTGITTVKVTVVGGGGNGGGTANSACGGGGGGGLSVRYVTGLTPGGTVTATVGAVAGTSSFGAFASATGGASVTTGTAGGAGGTGSSGTYNIAGGAGGAGVNIAGASGSGGGGGGGGGALGPDGPAVAFFVGCAGPFQVAFPAYGGAGVFGRGGTGFGGAGNGTAANGFGNGGGGGGNGASQSGGAGSTGIVVVEW